MLSINMVTTNSLGWPLYYKQQRT